MSFGINFNNNQPVIKGAQAPHDGGAGNLGYFEGGRKKEEKDSQESVFDEKDKNVEDSFVKEGEEKIDDDGFSVSKFIAEIILSIKDFVVKIFKK